VRIKNGAANFLCVLACAVVLSGCQQIDDAPEKKKIGGSFSYPDIIFFKGIMGVGSIIRTGLEPADATLSNFRIIRGGDLPKGVSLHKTSGRFSSTGDADVFPKKVYTVAADGIGKYEGVLKTSVKISVEIKKTQIGGSFAYIDPNTKLATSSEISVSSPTKGTTIELDLDFSGVEPKAGIETLTNFRTKEGTPILPSLIVLNNANGTITIKNSANKMSKTTYTIQADASGKYGGTIEGTVTITIK
jgi:hypothetical protein